MCLLDVEANSLAGLSACCGVPLPLSGQTVKNCSFRNNKQPFNSVCVLALQSLMLQIAANWLEQEANEIAAAKEAYMAEKCPDPDLSGDQTALMVKKNSGMKVYLSPEGGRL